MAHSGDLNSSRDHGLQGKLNIHCAVKDIQLQTVEVANLLQPLLLAEVGHVFQQVALNLNSTKIGTVQHVIEDKKILK